MCNFAPVIIEEMTQSNTIYNTNTHKVISLFSGAGGLDIGFESAGFEVAVAVEVDPSCCDTLRTNKPDMAIINKSIVDVTGQEVLDAAGLIRKRSGIIANI